MAKTTVTGIFVFKSSVGWLNNLLSDSKGGKKLERATKKYFLWKKLRPQTNVILELILKSIFI